MQTMDSTSSWFLRNRTFATLVHAMEKAAQEHRLPGSENRDSPTGIIHRPLRRFFRAWSKHCNEEKMRFSVLESALLFWRKSTLLHFLKAWVAYQRRERHMILHRFFDAWVWRLRNVQAVSILAKVRDSMPIRVSKKDMLLCWRDICRSSAARRRHLMQTTLEAFSILVELRKYLRMMVRKAKCWWIARILTLSFQEWVLVHQGLATNRERAQSLLHRYAVTKKTPSMFFLRFCV
jgi:hypothetical protein